MFLDKYENKDTQDVYSRLFKLSYNMEQKLGKDLFDFNQEQFEYYIEKLLKPSSNDSVRLYCSILIKYVQWAIDKGFREDIYNPLKRSADYFYDFVQEKKKFISYEEKEAILSALVNKQDGFILEGLWHGIQGSQVCELVNLQMKDINAEESEIHLRGKDGEITRTLIVDEEDRSVIEMAYLANAEKEYFKANGTVDYSAQVSESVELFESDYVLKSANTQRKGRSGGDKITHYTVYNRIDMIRSLPEMDEYADALLTKNIVRSGMIHMALKLYARDQELERRQIEEICKKYNLKYKWALRDYLNLENLKSLYPKEMKEIQSMITMDN